MAAKDMFGKRCICYEVLELTHIIEHHSFLDPPQNIISAMEANIYPNKNTNKTSEGEVNIPESIRVPPKRLSQTPFHPSPPRPVHLIQVHSSLTLTHGLVDFRGQCIGSPWSTSLGASSRC